MSNAVGSLVSPGSNGVSGVTGHLTVTTNAYLNGTTWMKVDAGNNTNDLLTVGVGVNIGGTLVVIEHLGHGTVRRHRASSCSVRRLTQRTTPA